jgi:hypothetical protein
LIPNTGRYVPPLIITFGPHIDCFQALNCLRIGILGGVARDRYCIWEVSGRTFWQTMQCQENVVQAYNHFANRKIKERSVLVELVHGGPLGKYFYHMVKDHRRVKGLFIQAYGIENEVPCRLCERRLIGSEDGGHNGMWPYFGCRSIPGWFSGCCGNCADSVDSNRCEFTDPKFEHLLASEERRSVTTSNDINGRSAPLLIKMGPEQWKTVFKKMRLKVGKIPEDTPMTWG